MKKIVLPHIAFVSISLFWYQFAFSAFQEDLSRDECKIELGHGTVLGNLNDLINGFNSHDEKRFNAVADKVVDDAVTITRINKNGAVESKKGKNDYKDHAKKRWETDAKWEKVSCGEVQHTMNSLAKIIVKYDLTSRENQPVPALAIMFFNDQDGKLVDATFTAR